MKTLLLTLACLLAVAHAQDRVPRNPGLMMEAGYGLGYAPSQLFGGEYPSTAIRSTQRLGPGSLRLLFIPDRQSRIWVGVEMAATDLARAYFYPSYGGVGAYQIGAIKGMAVFQADYLRNERLTGYVACGAGLQKGYISEEHTYTVATTTFNDSIYRALPLLTARIATGFRLALAPGAAVYIEAGFSGIGGPLVSGGLSASFFNKKE